MNGDTTLKARGDSSLERPIQRRVLLVLYAGEQTRIVELHDGQAVVIGRGPDVDVVCEDSRASRRHARIRREGNTLLVEDLASTNGTRVNGVPVSAPQRVGPGDEVGIGSASLVVSAVTLTAGLHRVLADGEFEERLEAEVDRARRYHRPVSLAMIRLAGAAAQIREQLSSMAAVLRRMDALASYGPREYAVLFPEADSRAAGAALERALASLGQALRAQVHVGTASYPVDAHNSGMLLEVARARLRGARLEGQTAQHAPRPPSQARSVIAESRAMVQVLALARRIGAVDTTALILGETGSGKQVVAEEMHRSSARRTGPLVHVNCAAVPPALLESELFGHERGAFTGADSRRIGFVEAAAGGTLFLDEIGELPEQAQPKLLHFLESRSFTRLGGVRPLQSDVRILAATNRDLAAEVREGRFREDLYFRLSAMVLHVPALRERPEDIRPLAEQFIAEFAASLGQPLPLLSEEAAAALQAYDWPGNVRELRNVIERAVVLAEGTALDALHLPERLSARRLPAVQASLIAAPLDEQLAAIEAQAIEAVLRECSGNQSAAARRLGITRRSLIYRMAKLGLR